MSLQQHLQPHGTAIFRGAVGLILALHVLKSRHNRKGGVSSLPSVTQSQLLKQGEEGLRVLEALSYLASKSITVVGTSNREARRRPDGERLFNYEKSPVDSVTLLKLQPIQQRIFAMLKDHTGPSPSLHTVSFTSPSSVLHLLPLLFQLAELEPVQSRRLVLQVPAFDAAAPGESNYGDVLVARQCGLLFLHSTNAQEAAAMALIAYVISQVANVPVVHFFDPLAGRSSLAVPGAAVVPPPAKQSEILSSFAAKRPLPEETALEEEQKRAAKAKAEKEAYAKKRAEAKAKREAQAQAEQVNGDGQVKIHHTTRRSSGRCGARKERELEDDGGDMGESRCGGKTRHGRKLKADEAADGSRLYSRSGAYFASVNDGEMANLVDSIMGELASSLGKRFKPFEYVGAQQATHVFVALGSAADRLAAEVRATKARGSTGVVLVRLYRPFDAERFNDALPETTRTLTVLDEASAGDTGPLYLDVAVALQARRHTIDLRQHLYNKLPTGALLPLVGSSLKDSVSSTTSSASPLGAARTPVYQTPVSEANIPSLTLSHLQRVFGPRLCVGNQHGELSSSKLHSASHGFGELVGKALEHKKKVSASLSKSGAAATIARPSFWLLTDDSDAGVVQNVLRYKARINLMLIQKGESPPAAATTAEDTTPPHHQSNKAKQDWKRDLGLYAMTYGGVYVASVAPQAHPSQFTLALQEADAFDGPALLLVYGAEGDSSAEEEVTAVREGRWHLYRWNPSKAQTPFTLDSNFAKKELTDFLRRDNHLSMVSRAAPNFTQLPTLDDELAFGHRRALEQVSEARAAASEAADGLKVLIAFGSDGGNAERIAKRFGKEGKLRGLKTKVVSMDECELETISEAGHMIYVVSTAGQGEQPANAKQLYTSMKANTDPSLFQNTHFAVFSMGDSHYWPAPGDEIYFAKAGKDIDAAMLAGGGQQLVNCGIGDDQDVDGFETGYSRWAPEVFEALGVGGGPTLGKEAVVSDDVMKIASDYLRGTIAEGLKDKSTGELPSFADRKLIKHHGIYGQDNRDIREERKKEGLEPAYVFMSRIRVPGGSCTPAQYLSLDHIANTYCNNTLKLTTRQTFQFHGILKANLKTAIAGVNRALMDTLAACGDVNRNVMASAIKVDGKLYEQCQQAAVDISAHLSPRTSAYHEIWLDKKKVAGYVDQEPLYTDRYLPRKFKIAIAIPPYNDVDVFSQCLGFIAIADETGSLTGFNVVVGGGMGMGHGNKATYPCVGQELGYCTTEEAMQVAETVMLVQRDYGDRINRKHARLKYTLRDMTVPKFKQEVETRLGWKFQPARTYHFETSGDLFGWHQSNDQKWHFTLFVEHGRIKDREDGYSLMSGLRHIAKVHKGRFRLTPNANFVIADINEGKEKKLIEKLLDKYQLSNEQHSGLRLNSMACAALPYCAMAFAEAERYMPILISKLEDTMEAEGLRSSDIIIRMSGCPNGCSRPYLAEVALVGKAPETYNLYLGGAHNGSRLNKLYRENVNEQQILETLGPLFNTYARKRLEGESFGDFVIRTKVIQATKDGPDFHQNLNADLSW